MKTKRISSGHWQLLYGLLLLSAAQEAEDNCIDLTIWYRLWKAAGCFTCLVDNTHARMQQPRADNKSRSSVHPHLRARVPSVSS
ncbi:hypothetical protein F4861DRAFT_492319 [Xylaria intraflava]|nr:hypothetical protein F4861DRAFT_492319 [Xylaria intraflava]